MQMKLKKARVSCADVPDREAGDSRCVLGRPGSDAKEPGLV